MHASLAALRARPRLLSALELGIVLLWTLAFAWPYLNPDPWALPTGLEYPTAVQPFYFWERLRDCGLCALWNGSVRGGYPALAETHAGILHPLPALGALLLGVPNGMKLALFGALLLAGVAQWWLGAVVGAGRIARTWAACMAVVAGNLAGKMDGGWINLVIAGAACALVFPPLIRTVQTGSRRWAIVFAACLAMALVAGQGYLQAGMLVLLPLSLVLVEPRKVPRALGQLALGIGLALLFAAPFLAPLLHFLPEFGKDQDGAFTVAQPLRFTALNLLIDDLAFFRDESLGKVPFPGLYVTFVGWIPVLLAIVPLASAGRGRDDAASRRIPLYLALVVLGALALASAFGLPWLLPRLPESLGGWIAGFRNIALMAGLAVPPLLALSALGLQRLLDAEGWPTWMASVGSTESSMTARLDTRWLLVVPLAFALYQAASFSGHWVETHALDEHVLMELESLRTEDLQWVSGPFGEHAFVMPGVDMGLKMASDLKPWHWRDHPDPEAALLLVRGLPPDGYEERERLNGTALFAGPEETAYALVDRAPQGITICEAQGVGGSLRVTCDAPTPGLLRVKEHAWQGWRARLNGEPVALTGEGPWIELPVAGGPLELELRYRPWDVGLGLVLGLLGVGLEVFLWRREGRAAPVTGPTEPM